MLPTAVPAVIIASTIARCVASTVAVTTAIRMHSPSPLPPLPTPPMSFAVEKDRASQSLGLSLLCNTERERGHDERDTKCRSVGISFLRNSERERMGRETECQSLDLSLLCNGEREKGESERKGESTIERGRAGRERRAECVRREREKETKNGRERKSVRPHPLWPCTHPVCPMVLRMPCMLAWLTKRKREREREKGEREKERERERREGVREKGERESSDRHRMAAGEVVHCVA